MALMVLGLGSNCGDRRASVEAALRWLSTVLSGMQASPLYETPPVRTPSHPSGWSSDYVNCVAAGDYDGSARDLQLLAKEYERSHGRDMECRRAGKVPIDIDVVVAGGEVLRPYDYKASFFRIGLEGLEARGLLLCQDLEAR